jgi:chromate transporter
MSNSKNRNNFTVPSLANIFISFFRLGISSFGGPAIVAYMQKMVVKSKKWLDEDSFNNGVALCQIIPGAIVMQMSAYVGLKIRGVKGAVVSYLGFGLPAFILMIILSAIYVKWHNVPLIISLFKGLRAIIIAIVAFAAVSFGKSYLKKWKDIIIAIISALFFWFGINPVVVIFTALLLGILLYRNQTNPDYNIVPIEKTNYSKFSLLFFLSIFIIFIIFFFFNRNLFNLSTLMFRIDLFAFGGGFAAVPLMFHEIVEVRSWMDSKTFIDGIALGQITPGPVVITATFIGYVLQGFFGGIVATASVFSPSFLMVIGIAPEFERIKSHPSSKIIINAILSSFVGLLLSVLIKLITNIQWNFVLTTITCISFILLLLKVDTLWIVVGGIVISIILKIFNII